ncbi:MAG: aldolase/citrate lyase family protein [Thermoprotei archaeon]|nr:aldolase/citrate lyase family protein [Thermoprotei archaeon]
MHRLVEKALKGETLVGTWLTMNSPEVAEGLSFLPLDFVVIDMEHSPLDPYDVEVMLIALKGSQTAGIVRVPWNSPVAIKRVLDLGPDGILVPWVSSLEEAKQLEKAILYPPRGIRGVGPRRAVKYGLVDRREYYEKYLENLIVIAQVETRGAIENLEGILSVETVTGVLVGPSDLSASLGIFGQIDSPAFMQVIEEVARKARARKPLVAIYAPTLEYAREARKLGFNMVALSSDIEVLLKAYNNMIREFKTSP